MSVVLTRGFAALAVLAGVLGVAGCGGSSHPANTTAAADVNGAVVGSGAGTATTDTSTASSASSGTSTTSTTTATTSTASGQRQGNGSGGGGATGGVVNNGPNDSTSSHGGVSGKPSAKSKSKATSGKGAAGKSAAGALSGTGAAGSGSGSGVGSGTGTGSSAPSANTGIPYEVDTTSMEPSFQPETKIYYDPTRTHPQIGEVVVFYLPAGAEEGACGTVMAGGRACATPMPGMTKNKEISFKRVVGLPGDSIAIDAGHVIRNGQPESEPQTILCEKNERLSCEFPTSITVPAGSYYLMADNRGLYKEDSRLLGAIPQEYILGTVEGG
jgi:signal peptidase I